MKKLKQIQCTLKFRDRVELRKMLEAISDQVDEGTEKIEAHYMNDRMLLSRYSFEETGVGKEKCINGKSCMIYKSAVNDKPQSKLPR